MLLEQPVMNDEVEKLASTDPHDTVNNNVNEAKDEEGEGDDNEVDDGETSGDDISQRKVVVYNVLKFSSTKEMTTLSKSWVKGTSIVITKVRKPPNTNFVVLTLQSKEMAQPFIDLINNGDGIATTTKKNKRTKGNVQLFARRVSNEDDEDDPISSSSAAAARDAEYNYKKRDANNSVEDDSSSKNITNNKKGRRVAADDPVPKSPDEVRDVITPLWKIPYEKQLEIKKLNMIKKCAMSIHKEIKSIFR
jgi:hypothetical protein